MVHVPSRARFVNWVIPNFWSELTNWSFRPWVYIFGVLFLYFGGVFSKLESMVVCQFHLGIIKLIKIL